MTSTTTGLPDRYRPLDQVGPDEPTPTGVIRCWRAKDRVLNRDVAIRVHTPAGPAAHAWITRALTAGGLATPALAMVYDASEGTGDPATPGGAAYVVNEWIDGETLTERLARGPLPERDVRTVLRRLAEGVAEAHRVGLAVGGLSTDNVVLRPNGLVGLRAVPAATGTVEGDIAALGTLLEACLTGLATGGDQEARPLTGSSDLLALVRRAKSADPGQHISSVAAMVALLKERPRSGVSVTTQPQRAPEENDGGWRRRMRDRKAAAAAGTAGVIPGRAPETVVRDPEPVSPGPERMDPQTMPPVPPVRPVGHAEPVPPEALGGDTINASTVAPVAGAYAGAVPAAPPPNVEQPGDDDSGYTSTYDDVYADDRYDDEPFGVLSDRELDDYQQGPYTGPYTDAGPATEETETSTPRRRLLVIGLPLLALVVVIGLALWIGNTLLSVTGSVDDNVGSTPSAGASSSSSAAEEEPVTAGEPIEPAAADVFDPFGDGEPENNGDVPLSSDGDPATAWSTLNYRGSPAFGNLKPGVGVLYDLGSEQQLAGVTVTSTTPGATVEIRIGDAPDGPLDSYATAGSGTIEGTTEFTFDEPATARYVLVWITGLVEGGEGFSADLAEVSILSAG
jgi:serine/threonine protein kinase